MESRAARTSWAPLAAGLVFGVVGAMLGAWAGYQASAAEFTVALGAAVPVLLVVALSIVLLAIAGYLAWVHLSVTWAITGVAALVVGSLVGNALAPVHPTAGLNKTLPATYTPGTATFTRSVGDPSWQSVVDEGDWIGEWTGTVLCERQPGGDAVVRISGGPRALSFTASVLPGETSIVLAGPVAGVSNQLKLEVVAAPPREAGAARVPGTGMTLSWQCGGALALGELPTPPPRRGRATAPPTAQPTPTPPILKPGEVASTGCEAAVVAYYEALASDQPWETEQRLLDDFAAACTEAELLAANEKVTTYWNGNLGRDGSIDALCNPEVALVDPQSLLCQSRSE